MTHFEQNFRYVMPSQAIQKSILSLLLLPILLLSL
jgi:hypothetical protein